MQSMTALRMCHVPLEGLPVTNSTLMNAPRGMALKTDEHYFHQCVTGVRRLGLIGMLTNWMSRLPQWCADNARGGSYALG